MKKKVISIFLNFFFTLTASTYAISPQQELVERCKLTVQTLGSDPNHSNIPSLLSKCAGVMIIPTLVRAGFVFGAETGTGVLLAKKSQGNWAGPVFVRLIGGSVGLQIGVDSSELMLIIMTERGLNSLMNDSFTLGAGVSIAAGPVGGGVSASTTANLNADIYSYSRSKGVFGGGMLKGSVIKARYDWNKSYYGFTESPIAILVQEQAKNSAADSLKTALNATENGMESHEASLSSIPSPMPLNQPAEIIPFSPQKKAPSSPQKHSSVKPLTQEELQNSQIDEILVAPLDQSS
jgi:SH3 domain-containing YSC84-like protein 1